jgi:hypothetical protein
MDVQTQLDSFRTKVEDLQKLLDAHPTGTSAPKVLFKHMVDHVESEFAALQKASDSAQQALNLEMLKSGLLENELNEATGLVEGLRDVLDGLFADTDTTVTYNIGWMGRPQVVDYQKARDALTAVVLEAKDKPVDEVASGQVIVDTD